MYFDDFNVGDTFELESISIDRQKMMEFAHDYDPQKIHTDEEHGRDSRFADIIAPGIMSFMSVWAKFVKSNIIFDNFIAAQNFRIDWLAPVFAGDELTGKVKITRIEPRNKYNGIVDVNLAIFNQEGRKVMDTVTEAILNRRQGR